MASVYRHFSSAPRPAALAPGELVWARVINGIENPNAVGKPRPVVLIESKGSLWRTMGLTTNPSYQDGSPRVAIPNPRSVGLRGPGWLWGSKSCWVSSIDIEEHIGWVDGALAFQVIKLAGLRAEVIHQLLKCVRKHYPPTEATLDPKDGCAA